MQMLMRNSVPPFSLNFATITFLRLRSFIRSESNHSRWGCKVQLNSLLPISNSLQKDPR